jgi:hypothetical protein
MRTRSFVVDYLITIIIILSLLLSSGCEKKNNVQSISVIANEVGQLIGDDVIVIYYNLALNATNIIAGVLIEAEINNQGEIRCSIVDISGKTRYVTTDLPSIKLFNGNKNDVRKITGYRISGHPLALGASKNVGLSHVSPTNIK